KSFDSAERLDRSVLIAAADLSGSSSPIAGMTFSLSRSSVHGRLSDNNVQTFENRRKWGGQPGAHHMPRRCSAFRGSSQTLKPAIGSGQEASPMSVAYRRARAEEVERAEELVVRSINDLTERHGFGPMATLRPPQFQLFSWNDDPDGLWVAEDAGQMLGFAFSWVCGDLWFLAE